MPLLATSPTNHRLEAWRLSEQDWAALKARYRDLGLRAGCCGRAAIPVTSPTGWQFFRHAPGDACAAHERPGHIVAKTIVARAAAALGFAVTTEARGEAQGEGWVADVLVEAPRWTVAIEVQLSRLPLDAIVARQRRYAAAGIRGAWLVGGTVPGYEADPSLPLFRLLSNTGNAPPSVVPMVRGSGAVRLGLERFTTKLLTGRVRFVAAAPAPHLVVAPGVCRRCHRDVTRLLGVGGVAGHPVLAPGGVLAATDLAKIPEVLRAYRAALPMLLARRPELAVMRPGRREALGWVARCPECDSALPPDGRPSSHPRSSLKALWAFDGSPLPAHRPPRATWTWGDA